MSSAILSYSFFQCLPPRVLEPPGSIKEQYLETNNNQIRCCGRWVPSSSPNNAMTQQNNNNSHELIILAPLSDASTTLTPVQGVRTEEINHLLQTVIRTSAIELTISPPPEYIRFQSNLSIAFRFISPLELKVVKDFVKSVSKKLLTTCYSNHIFPPFWIVDITMELNTAIVSNTLFTELRNVHIHNAAEAVWSASTVISLPVNAHTMKVLAATTTEARTTTSSGQAAECHIHYNLPIEVLEYMLKRNYLFLHALSILDTSPICYWKKGNMKIHQPQEYTVEQFLSSFDGVSGGKFPFAAERLVILELPEDHTITTTQSQSTPTTSAGGILILLPEYGMYSMRLASQMKGLLVIKAFQEGFIHHTIVATPLGRYHQLCRSQSSITTNNISTSSGGSGEEHGIGGYVGMLQQAIPTVSSYSAAGVTSNSNNNSNNNSNGSGPNVVVGGLRSQEVPIVEATLLPSSLSAAITTNSTGSISSNTNNTNLL